MIAITNKKTGKRVLLDAREYVPQNGVFDDRAYRSAAAYAKLLEMFEEDEGLANDKLIKVIDDETALITDIIDGEAATTYMLYIDMTA